MPARLLVLVVWLAMFAWAIAYISTFAPRFPVGDEIALWRLLPPDGRLAWENLWRLHNEHRFPLPRLVHYLPYPITGSLLPAMYLQAALFASVALGMIALARRLRGRTQWTDVFFPLLWLHTGNWANLLSGFQLTIMLPTLIVAAMLAGIAVSPDPPGPRRALGLGLGLVSLALCGGVGLTQAPALAAWIGWRAWSARRGRRILIAALLVWAALCAIYVLEYQAPKGHAYAGTVGTVLAMSAVLFSLGLGPVAETWWPASAVLVGCVCAATIGLLVAKLGRERARQLGLLAAIAGSVCLVLAMGIGRPEQLRGGFTPRYVLLTAPLLCCAYFAWALYGGRIGRSIVCGGLALVALSALPVNAKIGLEQGRALGLRVREFEARVQGGARPLELVQLFTKLFPPYLPEPSRRTLRALAAERKPPFDEVSAVVPEGFDYLTFNRLPARVEGDPPPTPRFVEGVHALLVAGGTEIRFDLRPEDRRLVARFGVPPELYRQRKSGYVRCVVELQPVGGPPVVLLTRTLDPETIESDRGVQSLELGIPPGASGELVLRTETSADVPQVWSWSYWADVVID